MGLIDILNGMQIVLADQASLAAMVRAAGCRQS